MSPRSRRFAAAVVAGVVLLGLGAGALWHFWLRRPSGDGPVGIPVAVSRFAQPWTAQEVALVALGDSVTAGFGAAPGRSYVERLVANPPEEYADLRGICLRAVLPSLSVTNLAMSGSTSHQCEKAQLPRLHRHAPQVLGLVVLTTGGNDLIHNYGRTPPVDGAMYGATWDRAQPWIQGFEARLERILAGIRGAFPGGCHIFLANIYDPSDGTGNLRWVLMPPWPDGLKIHAAYNRILAAADERHPDVHLVDIHQPFLGHGLYCTQFWGANYRREDPHHWYLENVEDPNDRGYDALRRLFLNAIADVLAPPVQGRRLAP